MKRLTTLVALAVMAAPVSAQEVIRYKVIAPGGQMNDGALQVYGVAGQSVIGVVAGPANGGKIGYSYLMRDYYVGHLLTVAITSFDAGINDNGVDLSWEIGEANGLRGFNVYRAEEVDGLYHKVHDQLLMADDGFHYRDETIRPGRQYSYRLGAVDDDGEVYSAVVTIQTPAWQTSLEQNYPNPFNPATTIEFYLAEPRRTQLRVFDVKGRLVRTLVDEGLDYGRHKYQWDGTNNNGQQVSSGVYFYRFQAGNKVFTKKMMLLK